MEDVQNSSQNPPVEASPSVETAKVVTEEKVSEVKEVTAQKASSSKDSIVSDLKKSGKTILGNVKSLPGALKVKLFVGLGLIFATFLSYIAVFHFGSKPLFLISGFFYPIMVAAITVLSAYKQNDFFEALMNREKKTTTDVTHPEIHSENEIHHIEEETSVKKDV